MQRSRRQHGLVLVAMLFAAGPFVAALIRAVGTGSDFRLLWIAIASFIAANVIMAVGTASGRTSSVVLASVVTFVITALVAASVAFLLGARAAVGVWAIAIVFALFLTVGGALFAVSRPGAL